MLNAGLAAPTCSCEPGKLSTGRFGCCSLWGSREVIHECPTLKRYRNISLSEVISILAGLLRAGPKMMLMLVESFACGVASIISGTSAVHRAISLVLYSDLAQNPIARCRYSHSASCVPFMFSRSVCIEEAISFHPGKCVGVSLKLTQSAP